MLAIQQDENGEPRLIEFIQDSSGKKVVSKINAPRWREILTCGPDEIGEASRPIVPISLNPTAEELLR